MKKTLVTLSIVFVLSLLAWLAYPTCKQWKEKRFLSQAELALAKQDYRAAAFSVRKTLEINPTSVPACRLMARLAEQLRMPQATMWRARVADLEPAIVTNHLDLARTALLFGNVSEAGRALQRIKPPDRETVDFQMLFAMTAFAQNNLASAEEHCLKATLLDPENKFARFNLAVLHVQSTNSEIYETAVKTLEAMRLDPVHGRDALRNLISAALKRNDFRSAQACSEQLLAVPPVAFEDRLIRLSVLKDSQSPDISNYLAGLESLAKENEKDLLMLGYWLRNHRMSDEAVAWLQNLPDKMRSQKSATQLIAECNGDLGNYAQVETVLGDQRWAEGDFVRLALLAHARKQLGRKFAGQTDWTAAVQTASGNLKPLYALLNCSTEWNWPEEREDVAWKIIQQFPAERSILTLLENIYVSEGNSRGLQKVYAAMMKYASTNSIARNNFAAVSLLINRQMDEAQEIAHQNFVSHPDDGTIASTYAYALHLEGQTVKGLQLLSKLNEEDLQKPAIATYYGVLLAATGKTNEARPYLEIASKSKGLLPEEKKLIAQAQSGSAN